MNSLQSLHDGKKQTDYVIRYSHHMNILAMWQHVVLHNIVFQGFLEENISTCYVVVKYQVVYFLCTDYLEYVSVFVRCNYNTTGIDLLHYWCCWEGGNGVSGCWSWFLTVSLSKGSSNIVNNISFVFIFYLEWQ